VIAQWDPHTHPIVTEVAGIVELQGMEEGLSVNRQTDELTGLTNIVVMDPKDRPSAGKDLRPAVVLLDDQGETVMLPGSDLPAHYFLPNNSILSLQDGERSGGRHHRPDSAGRLEDPRHHRRSAARGGPVRGPQAEGAGHSRGVLGYRQLRQGNQGQAPAGGHAAGWRYRTKP
jgi:hypothetical protein